MTHQTFFFLSTLVFTNGFVDRNRSSGFDSVAVGASSVFHCRLLDYLTADVLPCGRIPSVG